MESRAVLATIGLTVALAAALVVMAILDVAWFGWVVVCLLAAVGIARAVALYGVRWVLFLAVAWLGLAVLALVTGQLDL